MRVCLLSKWKNACAVAEAGVVAVLSDASNYINILDLICCVPMTDVEFWPDYDAVSKRYILQNSFDMIGVVPGSSRLVLYSPVYKSMSCAKCKARRKHEALQIENLWICWFKRLFHMSLHIPARLKPGYSTTVLWVTTRPEHVYSVGALSPYALFNVCRVHCNCLYAQYVCARGSRNQDHLDRNQWACKVQHEHQ